MTTRTLPDLLTELAEDAPRLDPGAAALAEARRRRHRTVSVAGAVVGVLALVVAVNGFLAARNEAPEPAPTSPDSASSGDSPLRSVSLSQEATLPWTVTPLPWHLGFSRGLTDLSDSPVNRARALIAPGRGDGLPGTGVLVLGDDGRMRLLDTVELTLNGDEIGRVRGPLTSRSLSPDGRWAAFPQRDRLVLVELTSGKVVDFAVPGPNSHVVWSPDGRHILVGDERGSYYVDRNSGEVSAEMDAVTANAAFVDQRTVIEWTRGLGGGAILRTSLPPKWSVSSVSLAEAGVYYGPPAVDVSLVARAVVDSEGNQDLIVVADRASGRILKSLRLTREAGGDQRSRACCAVLGWHDGAVLFESRYDDAYRVLRWEWRTGDLTRVTELTQPADLSLAFR